MLQAKPYGSALLLAHFPHSAPSATWSVTQSRNLDIFLIFFAVLPVHSNRVVWLATSIAACYQLVRWQSSDLADLPDMQAISTLPLWTNLPALRISMRVWLIRLPHKHARNWFCLLF